MAKKLQPLTSVEAMGPHFLLPRFLNTYSAVN